MDKLAIYLYTHVNRLNLSGVTLTQLHGQERLEDMTVPRMEGCVFAFGRRIYIFDPVQNLVVPVVERDETITALNEVKEKAGEHQRRTAVFDASDGVVRRTFGDEEIARFESPVTSILDVSLGDHLKGGSFVRSLNYQNPDGYVFALMTGFNPRLVSRARGELAVLPSVGNSAYHSQMMCVSDDVFWTRGGQIIRGRNGDKVDFRAVTQSIRMVPLSGNAFAVCHFHNDTTHPEGVVIASRGDHRTLLTWDPDEFGYPVFVGSYMHNDKRYLLFGTMAVLEEDEDPYLYRAFTMPFRGNGGLLPVPQCIHRERYELNLHEPYGSPNCVATLDLKTLHDLVSSGGRQ